MRSLILIVFCISGIFSFAQQNVTNNNANSKSEEESKSTKQSNEPATTTQEKIPETKTLEGKKEDKLKTKSSYNQEKTESLNSSFYQYKSSANTQSTQRSPSIDQQEQMNEVVNYYEQNAPNSFEYHYFKYVSGNYNVSLVDHLYEAQKLKPKNVDVVVQLAAYYYITNQEKELKQNLETLKDAAKIESEILTYAKHVLNSVSENGILLTHGFDDTYSCLYAQKNQGIRKDVKIISLDFLQSEHYRNLLQQNGFVLPLNPTVDVSFMEEFCASNQQKNIQLSMTIPKPYLQAVVLKLEVVGLTFLYGNPGRDLISENKNIWESIKKDEQIYHYSQEKAKRISSNYLPMLLALKKQYELDKNTEKAKEIDQGIDRISVQCKKNQKIKSYK